MEVRDRFADRLVIMRRFAVPIIGVALAIGQLGAQDAAFDVASVKLVDARGGAWTFSPSGDVRIQAQLGYVIALAYEVPWTLWRHKFVLGAAAERLKLPEFPRVEIHAKGNPAKDSRSMLRTLLRERFGLRMRRETRKMSVFALTVKEPGKVGRWLQPSPHNCREFIARGGKVNDVDSPRNGNVQLCWPHASGAIRRDGQLVQMSAGTVGDLILQIQGLLDRPVVDGTQLNGNFTWQIAGVGQRGAIFTAFEEQLGLKFQPRTDSVEVFVIDDVRMPSPD